MIINSEIFKKTLRKYFQEIEEIQVNPLDKTINYTTPYTSASSFNHKDFLENEIKEKENPIIECFIDLDSKMEEEKMLPNSRIKENEIIIFNQNHVLEEKSIIFLDGNPGENKNIIEIHSDGETNANEELNENI